MLYLGIDQSLRSSGIALVDDHGAYVASTTLKVGRDVRGAQRLFEIRRGFIQFLHPYHLATEKLGGAAREGYSVGSTNRPYDLGMAAGVLLAATFELFAVEPAEVAPTSLKKFATGHGGADKAAMLYAVKTRLGVDLGDRDDEADAVWLARFAHSVATHAYHSRAAVDAVVALAKPKAPRLRPSRKTHTI